MPMRPDRARLSEERRSVRTTRMATGSLACTSCDAPVAPPPGRTRIGTPLACPYCGRRGPLRDFLSLAAPPRTPVVAVHVRLAGTGA